MERFVTPKVFMIGTTLPNTKAIIEYLKYTDQENFLDDVNQHMEGGGNPADCMVSLFAKLCYRSIVKGKNSNVSKVRDIENNLKACFDAGHGSVFEHLNFNFIVTNCSRVFTHELVRHRVGTAFSQTSGRYCRIDNLQLVFDPILEPAKEIFESALRLIEHTVYLSECKLGLRKPPVIEDFVLQERVANDPEFWLKYTTKFGQKDEDNKYRWVPDNAFDFEKRKKITSAIRRIAPNGQENEIAFSVNLRALRQMIQVRTAPAAEWEIRLVFEQIFDLVKERFPLMFYKARTKVYDGIKHVYGMKTQPFEIEPGDPKALSMWSTSDLETELKNRV